MITFGCLVAIAVMAGCPSDDVGYHVPSAWGNPTPDCCRYRTVLTSSCTAGIGDQTECYLVKVVLMQCGIRNPATQECYQYVDDAYNYEKAYWTRDCDPG